MGRVCCKVIADCSHEPWESPFLPLDWRARDARRVAAGENSKWADDCDEYVLDYVNYLRSIGVSDFKSGQVEVTQQWAAIHTACKLAERNDPVQWEVRARLLAGQSGMEIGVRYNLPPDAIEWYEQLFFAIRARRKAEKYLLLHTVGDGVHRGFLNPEVGNFWAWLALGGGWYRYWTCSSRSFTPRDAALNRRL